jgi:hypothetical protein
MLGREEGAWEMQISRGYLPEDGGSSVTREARMVYVARVLDRNF